MAEKDEHETTPPWDAASVNLISKEMAPGVFAVMPDDVFTKDHVATTAGFVIGERSVLVVESMLNGDRSRPLLRWSVCPIMPNTACSNGRITLSMSPRPTSTYEICGTGRRRRDTHGSARDSDRDLFSAKPGHRLVLARRD